jgi:hypothetical protein
MNLTTMATTIEMNPPALTGRHSLESCGMYAKRLHFGRFTDFYQLENEEIQGLAKAIHGHYPMIPEFRSDMDFTFATTGPLYSALATLPSLERVTLGLQEPETEERRVWVNPKSLTELLRAPALRFVIFDAFYFTNVLCYATASALEEGSTITNITFNFDCSFPDGGTAIIANALKTNVSVTNVVFF